MMVVTQRRLDTFVNSYFEWLFRLCEVEIILRAELLLVVD